MMFSAVDDFPSLLVPARFMVFADRDVPEGKRGRVRRQGVAWQGWNPDPSMETASARLPGSGSFYWSCAFRALAAAKQTMRDDATVAQISIETISGLEIGRLYREATR